MRPLFLETPLAGVLVIEPEVFGDGRGYFLETYQAARYREAGIDVTFVQDNLSRSVRGVLRGLHYQLPHPQAKLVSVIEGEVFDVAVDIRRGSPTFGKWYGVTLTGESHRQLYVPVGFAHGFCTLSETAVFHYKCSDLYHPECEHTIRWDDETIGIDWPIEAPVLSGKDRGGVALAEIDPRALPGIQGQGARAN